MESYMFRDITIDDKAVFDSYIKKKGAISSDECFSIFFAWRDYFKIKYTLYNGFLCAIATSENFKPFCFEPLGQYDEKRFSETIAFLAAYFERMHWKLRFRLIPEDDLDRFKRLEGYNMEYNPLKGLSDYVYDKESFVGLQGKKFEDKRRQVNWFRKNCRYECISVSEKEIPECFEVLEKWYAEADQGNIIAKWENQAARELLGNYTALDCKATLVRVDGRACAFVFTELLNDETVVSHIEKADKSIKGLYAFLNQEHYLREYSGVKHINLEEDLGLPGLVRSKGSYYPAFFVHKYEITMG